VAYFDGIVSPELVLVCPELREPAFRLHDAAAARQAADDSAQATEPRPAARRAPLLDELSFLADEDGMEEVTLGQRLALAAGYAFGRLLRLGVTALAIVALVIVAISLLPIAIEIIRSRRG